MSSVRTWQGPGSRKLAEQSIAIFSSPYRFIDAYRAIEQLNRSVVRTRHQILSVEEGSSVYTHNALDTPLFHIHLAAELRAVVTPLPEYFLPLITRYIHPSRSVPLTQSLPVGPHFDGSSWRFKAISRILE
ncbi:uncharacterized protein BT62DRAFT_1011176 [Guyanagaster necrorhizus]|uniref:Uncharacterized protein n=1 Tax=Guyanagaster necrorhizus TaxID=856835 RepID=A0A9P8APH2_9AGAR|nr:uncharacterized protein BT62DRAFT_1011176 [Guyanagaster necrorhizus MCA 3950]KAG7441862.1 hypothetical protein BT62DRAFT_1011176 [Guyanagaster necrorhizus MCA 3950]